MDVDPQTVALEDANLVLPTPMDVCALAPSAGGGPAPHAAEAPASGRKRLVLVLDTNVLLSRQGVQLLEALQKRYPPAGAGAGAAGAADGQRAADTAKVEGFPGTSALSGEGAQACALLLAIAVNAVRCVLFVHGCARDGDALPRLC